MTNTTACNLTITPPELCNPVVGSIRLGSDAVAFSDYGYTVASWSAYLFLVAFCLAAVLHIFIGSWKKHWWVLWTLGLGSAVEAIGWGGRLMSVLSIHWNENLGGFWEYDHISFIIQICCLVIGPTFYSAANYIILGKLINATGGGYSILTPRSFATLFMFGDFVCLVIQGTGGGLAGTAIDNEAANNGALIMTGGVVVQLAITVVFVGFLVDFYRRFRSQRPARRQFHPLPNKGFMRRQETAPAPAAIPLGQTDSAYLTETPKFTAPKSEYGFVTSNAGVHEMSSRGVSIVVAMLSFTTLLIVIRSVYRSVELTDGWAGPVAVDQGLFLGMDAFLMAILALSYVIIHPAFFLPRQKL